MSYIRINTGDDHFMTVFVDEIKDRLLALGLHVINHEQLMVLKAIENAKIGEDPDGCPCLDDVYEEEAICMAELSRREIMK